MVGLIKIRYVIAPIIALLLLFLLVAPVGEGALALKVFSREIKPKPNHRSVNQAIVCNVTDKPSDVSKETGWKLPSSITYRVNTASAPFLASTTNTIVSNSFSTWSDATAAVVFNPGSATSTKNARFDRQNIVAWNRLSRNTLGATYVWYYTNSGTVAEVDTIMNSRFTWNWTNPSTIEPPKTVDNYCPTTNAYDAQDILTHELGHWIGLDDLYSPNEEDLTMYGYGDKQELKKDTLESGDVLGVGATYPSP